YIYVFILSNLRSYILFNLIILFICTYSPFTLSSCQNSGCMFFSICFLCSYLHLLLLFFHPIKSHTVRSFLWTNFVYIYLFFFYFFCSFLLILILCCHPVKYQNVCSSQFASFVFNDVFFFMLPSCQISGRMFLSI